MTDKALFRRKCSLLTALSLFIKCLGCTRAEGMQPAAHLTRSFPQHRSAAPPWVKPTPQHVHLSPIWAWSLTAVCISLFKSASLNYVTPICCFLRENLNKQNFLWLFIAIIIVYFNESAQFDGDTVKDFVSWSPHRGYRGEWLCRSCAGTTDGLRSSVHPGLLQLCGCRLQSERECVNLVYSRACRHG